tara:strand:- start:225 stop:1268 length:1044 start_codon:yes stop_codon:yes gene_type:complete
MIDFFLILFISALGTYYVMPHSIRKLKENNLVVRDMYKHEKKEVATNAGIIVLFISFISISLFPLVVRILSFFFDYDFLYSDLNQINLTILLVISIYAIYGLVDDLVDLGHKLKFLLPITFSFPLISVINPETFPIPFYGYLDLNDIILHNIEYGDLLRIIIIPLYVMVVANLVNMHSGYNGLQSGLSLIILITLFVKSWLDGEIDAILPFASFLGSILIFWIYNKYPSKVFEGNVGSQLFGSLIGCIIVVQEYWWFGFLILFPHTLNFVLWIAWLIMIKTDPENYLEKDGLHRKFGKVEHTGIISVPNRLTLKWIPNYYFKLNEPKSVFLMYLVTLFFCLMALIIF